MVRGHAKAEAQKKNAARHAADAKSAKNTGAESRKIKEAGTTFICPTCKQGMPNIGAYKIHYESKHPKLPLPPDLQGV